MVKPLNKEAIHCNEAIEDVVAYQQNRDRILGKRHLQNA